jgi:hypothetical protein
VGTTTEGGADRDGKAKSYDLPRPFEEDFGEFIAARCAAAHKEALRSNPAYRKAREENSRRCRELWEKIKEKVGFELLDRFEGVHAERAGQEAETCYLQGLRDGLELAQKLWGRNGGTEHGEAARE